jgi:hypothetical protein
VGQASDLGFVHFHRSQFDTVVDGNATDVTDDPFAIFQRPFRKLFKGLPRGRDRLMGTGENPMATGKTLASAGHRGGPHPAQDFGNHATDQFFGGWHGGLLGC